MFHNLTSDEIELLSWFSKLSERNQGKIIFQCIDFFAEQSGMSFDEFTDILLQSEDYFSKYCGVSLIKEKR